MALIMVFGMMLLNFGISIWNAYAVGRSWNETKIVGGWPHFTNWCAAIMSASGFTWVYLSILGLGANAMGKLPGEYMEALFSLGYLFIIFPVLGSGLALMINSWAHFWRQKNLLNGGLAAWNTFAQVYNTMSAIRGVPAAFEKVMNVFGDRERSKNPAAALALFLVILSVAGGVLTTALIVRKTAAKHATRTLAQMEEQKQKAWDGSNPAYSQA